MSESPPSERRRLLERVPLFSCLSPSELDTVVDLLEEIPYRKGATVFREGDEGNSFFVILSGEVEVRTGAEAERVINRLGPGDFGGEIALLMGGRRSATIAVSRSARLLLLDRRSFDRHFLRNPKVLEHFARVLSKRLATANRRGAAARRTLTVGVRGRAGLRGKSLVAHALAGFLRDLSGREVLLLNTVPGAKGRRARALHPRLEALASAPLDRIKSELQLRRDGPTSLTLEVDVEAGLELLAEQLSGLLAKLGDLFPFAVLDLAARPKALAACTDEICDVGVEIVARPGPPSEPQGSARTRRYQVVNLHNSKSEALPINHCEPFVLAADAELAGQGPEAALAYLRKNTRSLVSVSLRRLARKLLGGTVGLAIGGGAAFGIAHVGVLSVFEENDIPVDLLAGTSMGSMIAMIYAAGLRASEMEEIARRLGSVRTTLSLLDFTLTRPGLLAGNRVMEILRPILGEIQTFEQLSFPCRAVATDIHSGERVTIGSGRLDAALRASSSVPMLMTPARFDGRILIDGGLVEPVPAQIVSEMGADICIAVNVVPPLRKGVETVLSRAYRRLNATFDVVMNSMQTLQHELGNFKAISADVRINPDLSGFTWIEFHRALELIERGAEAAERALPEIRRVLAERMGSPLRLPSAVGGDVGERSL
jgi:NTE family protein